MTVYNDDMYVFDNHNHRIQVFDLDLNFVRSIGSRGKGGGELDLPHDVKFDTKGHVHTHSTRIKLLTIEGYCSWVSLSVCVRVCACVCVCVHVCMCPSTT